MPATIPTGQWGKKFKHANHHKICEVPLSRITIFKRKQGNAFGSSKELSVKVLRRHWKECQM